MTDISTDERKRRLDRWIKLALVLGIGLVVSPVIFLAVKGLVGLAVAAIIGMTGVQLAPVLSMRLANWRMKLITKEAEKNPIETMRNVYLQQSQIIAEKDRKIVEFEGRIGDYHDKMVIFSRRYPQEAQKFADVEAKMNAALASMKRKQLTAKKDQADYRAAIDKADAIFQMALAAHEVTQLNADIEQEVFADIRSQVSFDSVNHRFNSSVAALSLEVDNEQAFTSIPSDNAQPALLLDGLRTGSPNGRDHQEH